MDDETSTPMGEPDPEEVIQGELVQSRAAAAYQLKMAGRSLREIADDLGYASDVEVAHAITVRMKYEAKFLSEAGRTGLIQLVMDRLEALHQAYWQGALAGDREDAKFVLSVIDRLVRLGQLDSIDTQTQQTQVLVIAGEEQDYVAKLKELTE
jgi:hypothetical protein